MILQATEATSATLARRELIHDLRNLFAVVASAKHMLEDRLSEDRQRSLLAAIEDAAVRGVALTTSLLAMDGDAERVQKIDVSNRLLALTPMIRALAGGDGEAILQLCKQPTVTRVCPELFEAAILELVANASAARRGGHVFIRTRRIGNRIIVIVADDGCGMDPLKQERVLTRRDARGPKGSGLGRVRQFVSKANGTLRIRSRAGRGTVVSLTLPTVLGLAVDEPASLRTRCPPLMQEQDHEED